MSIIHLDDTEHERLAEYLNDEVMLAERQLDDGEGVDLENALSTIELFGSILQKMGEA